MNFFELFSDHIHHHQGDYDSYECGLEISGADAEDDGDWECEFESYVKNGKRGDGYKAKVSFKHGHWWLRWY